MLALITGGSRGIGACIAQTLAKSGYTVVINYNSSEQKAHELVMKLSEQGYKAFALKADVGDCQQVNDMMTKIEKDFGGVDVLVNNAGIAQQKLFTDITSEDFDKMFNTNVKGVFNCCKGVLHYMINKKNGCIINISSMWGQVGGSCEVHYSASKAAVIGLTKALAKEIGLSGIRVNCVCPGVINTEMNSHLDEQTMQELKEETPLNAIGQPQDIADMVEFLCSEKAKFVTGQIVGVNGGMII